jgi:hypothetical protein
MTDSPVLDDVAAEEGDRGPRMAWEVPEIAGAAILVGVAVLIVGGLAVGIARALTTTGGVFAFSNQQTWAAVQFGAVWASPVVAVLLVGVLGLCWWQDQGWEEVVADGAEELSEARGHLRRARRMIAWTRVLVALTAVGSIALFAAALGINQGSSDWYDYYFPSGASTVATFALLAGAFWIDRKHTPAHDTDAA